MYCAEGARQVAMEEQEGIITLPNENGEEVNTSSLTRLRMRMRNTSYCCR